MSSTDDSEEFVYSLPLQAPDHIRQVARQWVDAIGSVPRDGGVEIRFEGEEQIPPDHRAAIEHYMSSGNSGTPYASREQRATLHYFLSEAGERLAELYAGDDEEKMSRLSGAWGPATWETPRAEQPAVIREAIAWLADYLYRPTEEDPVTEAVLDRTWQRFGGAFLGGALSAIIRRMEANLAATRSELQEEREQREAAERERAKTERELASYRERFPKLRRGLAFQRTLLQGADHVQDARRKALKHGRLSETAAELAKEFRYDPLTTYERLTMHALVSIAREGGLLDTHPWATASSRMPLKQPGDDPPRVRIAYPGASEIARIVGIKPGADGRIDGGTRTTYERAMRSLTNYARWFAIPVLYPPAEKGGEWVEDLEIRKDLWVRLSASQLTRGAYLDVHPAAVASHLKSFEDIPDLGALYESARDAMNLRQLRDEFAIMDDYLRWLAFSLTGKSERDRRKLQVPAPGMTAEQETITKRVKHTTLLQRTGLEAWAKKQGQRAGIKRVTEALTFCQHIGTLRPGFMLDDGVWTVALRHPANLHADPTQLLAFAEVGADASSPK